MIRASENMYIFIDIQTYCMGFPTCAVDFYSGAVYLYKNKKYHKALSHKRIRDSLHCILSLTLKLSPWGLPPYQGLLLQACGRATC